MANEQQLLARAFNLFQQGQLGEAEQLFKAIIAGNPRNFDAVHLLGLLNASKGNFEEARRLIEASLKSKINYSAYVENYASVLFQAKDFEEAAKVSSNAIRSKGASESLQYVRAISLYKLGRFDESLTAFDRLLARHPNNVAALNEKSAVLASLGRAEDALAQAEQALAMSPGYPPALVSIGHSYRALRRYRDADEAYGRALAIQPDLEAAWLGRACVFGELKRYDDAFAAYARLFAVNPKSLEARLARGGLFASLKRHDEALADFDDVLASNPAEAAAWVGRGNMLTDLKRYDEAFAAFDRALSINGQLESAWSGRGNALTDLARYDEALAVYDEGLGRCRGSAELEFAKSLVKLNLRDFATGWDLYERRFESADNKVYYATVLKKLNLKIAPDRSDLAGKNVAVLAEQGIGDEIMFDSILSDLAADAKAVTCECDARLVPLLARSFPSIEFIGRQDAPSVPAGREAVIKQGSLASIYRRDAAAFPQRPYLKAEPARVSEWREQLDRQAAGRLKVGITWRGGIAQTRINDRSLDLARLDVLTGVPDTCFVNLQYGKIEDELARFNQTHPAGTIARPLDDTSNEIDNLAALISALDLVISVQNTTVHLSGALGVPCWGLMPFRPEWRYGTEGRGMIWYPSVELFRQPKAGDWDAVLQDVRTRLTQQATARRN